MKYSIILILLFKTITGISQSITVEKVKLIETIDNKSMSLIPRVKDSENNKSLIVNSINSLILDRFMIDSYNQKEVDEFRWYDVDFNYEIKENILHISIWGEYVGAYPNYIEDEFFFDLRTGKLINPSIIPFHALFTLSGYFDFLNKYWLSGVKAEFKTAIECAEVEPYCSYYDINSYSSMGNKMSISLVNDCYPHVAQACSPGHQITVALDSVKQYLNELGKYILIESNYSSKDPIDKLVENEQLKERIPNFLFLFGRVDDKYPISIALNIENQNLISGYYYYDRKLQKLILRGENKNNVFTLIETFNGEQTGIIELKFSDKYHSKAFLLLDNNDNGKYLVGKWMNPDKSKTFDIKFTEVKMNDKN
ncbi:hypothetical protein [Marinigracilibium pacificum]|uniref:Uncharacterized protein n=1 Tax=Marinigracilibium pacificum TaxID=2729599 RepID=A0A848J508_9BACT|nr:hypothetical protein [Marinigracilibium pacificum]NMM50861.1 hypothetical protein [Marinigracilibium pacificum]